ncbi:hypothetical protein O6H91_12G012900 [Diphasiastrum complanatum]|uniref:Uncharacterized protein n=1 Tax=Diphasiastrum complanatum TaxID=34168 RepID=A0ACC2BZB8_DIPCM|nr:hypothetical protein O6H91_12G012900 [Diphasiastrum complanatum]
MVSYRRLLATVEAALAAPPPAAQQRAELAHALHICRQDFESFLQYPGPKSDDRSQVLSKEVNLPNAPPTILDDQDVQIALKLSDDLHLNEIDSVSLLVAAHQEWNLLGREPLEILRLASGLWFTERRALLSSLQLLLRAVVLDDELEMDFLADTRLYLEELIESGLRKRLVCLVKELNREEPAGLGGPSAERYVMDSRGSLVERSNIAQRERLSLCQCLVLSCFIVRINVQEIKDTYSLLKYCLDDLRSDQSVVKLQIRYTVMFAISISLISDALGGAHEMPSVLSPDGVFRREFQAQVMHDGFEMPAKGFLDVVRLVWAIFIMITAEKVTTGMSAPADVSVDEASARQCLDRACENNVFKFLYNNVLRTAAFQNDDEDLVFVYNAYLHKLLTSFLSHPLGRDKIKELKDLAMLSLDTYPYEEQTIATEDDMRTQQQAMQMQVTPFISMLQLISGIYQREPELMIDNEVLWTFVRFAGEDHTNYLTLVAFLELLSALASTEEGAKRVYLLLQNKAFRTVSWQTLFNSLNVYEEHFRQSLQTTGSLLPPFQEGDAKALEAYLHVLKRVMEAGNVVEKAMWFLDIEPLFKLLPYQNVPPYLKGALRSVIRAFVTVSPIMKEKIWGLLQVYDLPLVASLTESLNQQVSSQAYDMTFELNEVEARQEEYPSTISYLELFNTLMANELDRTDKGQRYTAIFRFVRDQVFAPYSQRAYSDATEKWKMVVAALHHFQMLLTLYPLLDEDVRKSSETLFQQETAKGSGNGPTGVPHDSQMPALELMKDLMSGKVIFRNVMSIIMLGVNNVLEERTNQVYGLLLEEAVKLSLELIVLAFSRDLVFADFLRPVYQPLDAILSHDNRLIVSLLEYVHYDPSPAIQQLSIQAMNILSARVPQLVSVIMEAGIAGNLREDYAACLEASSQNAHSQDVSTENNGSLILRLLISNLDRPAPNITHLLLKFDMDQPVERTFLQPKRHYSCLRVVLDLLDSLARPEVNASLHELGFQLVYDLCVDTVTSAPMVELLRMEKYNFFSKHLDKFVSEPLPERSSSQSFRINSLQQRAWLLKLLAVELHVSDMDMTTHRNSCRHLLALLFLHGPIHSNGLTALDVQPLQIAYGPSVGLQKIKVLELLDILQFPLPEYPSDFPLEFQGLKEEFKVDEILSNPATIEAGGIYTSSERGDRVIDLVAFGDRLWQEYKRLEVQYNLSVNEQRQKDFREVVRELLRWAWKRNKHLEEQAAQLHMLVGWCQLVEVAISRRFELLGGSSQVLFEFVLNRILDACLDAVTSTETSLKMAFCLSQVVMTGMAKLQEQSFAYSGLSENEDDVMYLDLLSSVRLSNSACHAILSKLTAAILRPESSEALRRRQYATLLSYFHYCEGAVNPDLSLSVLCTLLTEGLDGEDDAQLEKLDREQTELAEMNFAILKNDATAILDLVAKDATYGSDVGRAIAFYVLETLLGLDRNQVFFSQLQSRGLLKASLADISTNSYQALLLPSPDMVRQLYTLEAELALLLRACFYNRKRGAQALFAMGALQHLQSCRAVDVLLTEDTNWDETLKVGIGLPSQQDRQHQVVLPILRLVLSFTTLIDTTASNGKNRDEVALEILEFIKRHQGLFNRILRDESRRINLNDLEELQLATAILCKVWPLEQSEEFGFMLTLFNLSYIYFCPDSESRNRYVQHIRNIDRNLEASPPDIESARSMELLVAQIRCNLISYIHTLVTTQGFLLQVSRIEAPEPLPGSQYSMGRHRQPTLRLLANLLQQASTDLESAVEEKGLLIAKLQDVNELSRHELDEVIKAYGRQEYVDATQSLRKRRYVAMIEMGTAASSCGRQISTLLFIVEHSLEILYIQLESRAQPRGSLDGMNMEPALGRRDDLELLVVKMIATFEKLERINEEKVGHSMKHIQRLLHSLKSQVLRKFAPKDF